ncbi:hypothetical protein [Nostoc sp. JL23]|uniref:hypothetical protein n=1 Tax=Nostoc sp. JL23 TaxID=2815394 RepID=UPI001D5CD473|nr:hypothetical protein [Nostoc sp. JL23]MBN3875254.1 hypothetical protein [Nostoc sp. JL23]
MLLNQDPVILYGPNGITKSIPAIDAQGWISAGWATEPMPQVQLDVPSTVVHPQVETPPFATSKRKKPAAIENDSDTISEI